MKTPQDVLALELFAYVGEDELGSGELGLKAGLVPAGIIPLVCIAAHRPKLERGMVREQMIAQSAKFKKRIRFVRFKAVEIVWASEAGE